MPPAYKSMDGAKDTGYAPYDLYDLGEFDQKGSVRTKYGTKDEYLAAVKAVQAAGMHAYADIVFDHRMGADETEDVEIDEISPTDRNLIIRRSRHYQGLVAFQVSGSGRPIFLIQMALETFHRFWL